ncbi:HpcH/HpaI aldolase/citrate lyase family protein [Citricoccus muralis]|uniref:Citrate lyase subunit beta/citryl-CoA lyase n=1 Tax=Citricoccus muralis TaxID=169134 RepID=A0A3D9LFI0_9MICC|nr:CoA ester lyase [Citricoccus muralis]REE04932.1 citrate lyase subunit beta/citryl-CoA lyase [Citricoccus muralis]
MSGFSFGPSILFCPADRPERYAKAAAAADAVILDLEDAVAPADKAAAREHVVESSLDPATTIVRVNPVGGETAREHELDLVALAGGPYRVLLVAKVEDPAQLDHLQEAGYSVIALCETAAGVERAFEIARHPAVVALMWGAEDLVASMAGKSSRFADGPRAGQYREVARYARSRVLVAANAAGKVAMDTVFMDIADLVGLQVEAEDAVASGFAATACIHPSQAAVISMAYAPSAEESEWARAVLAESKVQPGVFRFRGRMVDEPILRQARRIMG